jgi:uncharacterized protein YgfB (UPF0149 family)
MQARKHFTDLSNELHNIGAPIDAAECHGFICAQLCLMERPDEQAWRDNLMPPDAETGPLETELRALGRDTHKTA